MTDIKVFDKVSIRTMENAKIAYACTENRDDTCPLVQRSTDPEANVSTLGTIQSITNGDTSGSTRLEFNMQGLNQKIIIRHMSPDDVRETISHAGFSVPHRK